MSDTSQGPGWWLASDGKWYPPELWTGTPGTGPSAQGAPSSFPTDMSAQAAPGAQSAPAYGYGNAPPYPAGAGTGASGIPPYAPGGYNQWAPDAVRVQKTNGLAVASLICSCIGFFFLPMILGIVFGFVARTQIRRSNGAQRGDGLAIAGIIVGFAWVAFWLVTFIVAAANSNNTSIVVPALAGLTNWL